MTRAVRHETFQNLLRVVEHTPFEGATRDWLIRDTRGNLDHASLPTVARLTIRIDLSTHGAIGPGKVKLLELVGESGSISAAGRAMGMSYRRAWTLISELNQSFRSPVVETQLGGVRGGGAVLTDLGHDVIACYRAVERAAAKVSAPQLAALDAARAAQPVVQRGRGLSRRHSPLMPRRARR